MSTLKRLSSKKEYKVEYFACEHLINKVNLKGINSVQVVASMARTHCNSIPDTLRITDPESGESAVYSIYLEAGNKRDFL